jgi:hypothetical protein
MQRYSHHEISHSPFLQHNGPSLNPTSCPPLPVRTCHTKSRKICTVTLQPRPVLRITLSNRAAQCHTATNSQAASYSAVSYLGAYTVRDFAASASGTFGERRNRQRPFFSICAQRNATTPYEKTRCSGTFSKCYSTLAGTGLGRTVFSSPAVLGRPACAAMTGPFDHSPRNYSTMTVDQRWC